MDDGIQLPPGAPCRVGKELIRVEMQPLLDLFDWQMAIQPDEVKVLGDQAYSYGLCEFVMTPKEGGNTIERNGKFLTILRRQIDGSWTIAIDCFNYDAPLG
jgi:ketosteroid isomerase-like protein